jgi:hypothetical protein
MGTFIGPGESLLQLAELALAFSHLIATLSNITGIQEVGKVGAETELE